MPSKCSAAAPHCTQSTILWPLLPSWPPCALLRPWLTWGAIQCCAILAERVLQGQRWAARVPRVAREALGQAAALTTLLVQLPLSPSLPGYLFRFHIVGAPFLLAAAAWRLRRTASERRNGPKLGVHTA